MISSYRRPGTNEYNRGVGAPALECNWQEERSRIEVGERVHLPLMEGAVVRPLEPAISIAPPTREPGKPSNGVLMMPERKKNSRATNNSERQGADDGFREYTSMTQTFFTPVEERNPCPVATDAYFHGAARLVERGRPCCVSSEERVLSPCRHVGWTRATRWSH